MTEPEQSARSMTFIDWLKITLITINLVVALALGAILSNVQDSQDTTSVDQKETRVVLTEVRRVLDEVQDTQEATYSVLDATVAAVQAGSPAAAKTRAQVQVLCDLLAGPDCPTTGEPTTTTSTVER